MIVDKQALVLKINQQLADNSTQEISPRDIRDNLLDIIDSVHLFTADQDITARNFATPPTRTTRAGDGALDSLKLAGYSSVDNSAFGASALRGNYTGVKNTAIGTYSMSCNLYGSTNVALGYNSLAGNVFGDNNVAIGSYTMQSSKKGDNNIAIGHGAGYYIGENDNYKLFIASHNINNDDLCSVTPGSGPNPLIYGDLLGNKLGINTTLLHSFGTLQVNGILSPTSGNKHDLGFFSPAHDYRWRNAYLANSINDNIYFNDISAARVKGDIVPDATNIYKIGDSGRGLLWDGFFNDLTVSGVANITNLNWTTINDCTYDCRTLYLASSGICSPNSGPCGYLSDTQVEGGGLVLQASGTDYKRDYHWTFLAPDYNQTCLDPDLSGDNSAMAHASWYSNISLKLESGRHIKTDRVIGRDTLALTNTNDCFGVFIKKDSDIIRTGKNWRNEQQRLLISAVSGTFKIIFKETASSASSTTAAIPYNATASDIQAALLAIGVTVSVYQSGNTDYYYGIGARTFILEFAGSLSRKDVPLMTVDASSLVGASFGSGSISQCRTIPGIDETQKIEVVANGGNWTLKKDAEPVIHSSFGEWNLINQLIPYNVSAAILKEALEDIFGDTTITVTRSSLSEGFSYKIVFSGNLGEQNHNLLIPADHSLTSGGGTTGTGARNERKKIKVIGDDGKWKIGWDASGAGSYTYSSLLDASATLSEVDAALDGLLGDSNHQTTFNSSTETDPDGSTWIVKEYEVTFIGSLGDQDIGDDQLIAVSDTSDPLRKSGTTSNVTFRPQTYHFIDGFHKKRTNIAMDNLVGLCTVVFPKSSRNKYNAAGDRIWMTEAEVQSQIGNVQDDLYLFLPFKIQEVGLPNVNSATETSHIREVFAEISIPLEKDSLGNILAVEVSDISDAVSTQLRTRNVLNVTMSTYSPWVYRDSRSRQEGIQNTSRELPQSYFMHETEDAKLVQAAQQSYSLEQEPSMMILYNGPVVINRFSKSTTQGGQTEYEFKFGPEVHVVFGSSNAVGMLNTPEIGTLAQKRAENLYSWGMIRGGDCPLIEDDLHDKVHRPYPIDQVTTRNNDLSGFPNDRDEIYYKLQIIKSDFTGGVNDNDLLKSTHEIAYTSDVLNNGSNPSSLQVQLDKFYSGYVRVLSQMATNDFGATDRTIARQKSNWNNKVAGKDFVVGYTDNNQDRARYGLIFEVIDPTLSAALGSAARRDYGHVSVTDPSNQEEKFISKMSSDSVNQYHMYIRYCDSNGNDLPHTRLSPEFNDFSVRNSNKRIVQADGTLADTFRYEGVKQRPYVGQSVDYNRLDNKPHFVVHKAHQGGKGALIGSANVTTLIEGKPATPGTGGRVVSTETHDGRADSEECITLEGREIAPVLTITEIQDGTDLIDDSAECKDNIAYITEEPIITPNPLTPSGTLGNIGDVNFISSGCSSDYIVAYSTLDSGNNITQRYVSNIQTTVNDNKFKEKISGFDLTYRDEGEVIDDITEQKKDRFLVSAYDNSTIPVNALTIMRNRNIGLVGITDIAGISEEILPETIFNIQATGIPENRTTGDGGAKLQLLGGSNNKKKDGVELEFIQGSRVANINMFRDYDKQQAVHISSENHVAIGNRHANEMLTIGSGVQTGTRAAISMLQSSGTINPSTDFGKVYVKEVSKNNQCQTIYFLDDCGNEFDLVGNKFATSGDRIYTDEFCNTHVGDHSPDDRHLIASRGAFGNTTLGSHALQDSIGSADNIAIGCKAGSGVTHGWQNILIGNNAGAHTGDNTPEPLTTGFRNTVLGHNLDAANSSYRLLVGNDRQLLMSGIMGPDRSDKILTLPHGRLSLTSADDFDALTIDSKSINLTDNANQYPDQAMDFLFTGPNSSNVLASNTLLSLKHHVSPMDPDCCTYTVPSPERPYAEVHGDFRLAGAIRFCDGTSMESASILSGFSIVGRSGIRTEIGTSETSIDLAIDKLSLNTAANATDFYLAVASGTTHSRINFTDLAGYISPLSARIDNCEDGQAGYRYMFTNNSVLGPLGCNSVYMGNEAGHDSNGWNHSVMIGTHAGRSATISYSSESEHASVFIGHQAGENTTGCYSSTFIGPNAGFNADGSYRSVFIGDEAGQNASSYRSVGIGDNALEGVTGTHNLEICTGIGKDGAQPWETRLMTGNMSYKMNIGDILAGDMGVRRMSVGAATVHSEDAVWSVRKDSYQGHNDIDWIQDSQQDDVRVAGVQKDGVPFAAFTYDSGDVVGRIYVEGYAQGSIAKPSSASSATTGQIMIKKEGWADDKLVSIHNRDTTLNIVSGDYVIAILINGEYRPIWVSC